MTERRQENHDSQVELEELSRRIVSDANFISDESRRLLSEGNRLSGRLQEVARIVKPIKS